MEFKLAGIIAAARLRALRLEESPARHAARAILGSDWFRKVKAEAWDEGWRAAWSPTSPDHLDHGPNPYRD